LEFSVFVVVVVRVPDVKNQDPLPVPTALLALDFWEVCANRKKTLVIFYTLFFDPYSEGARSGGVDTVQSLH